MDRPAELVGGEEVDVGLDGGEGSHAPGASLGMVSCELMAAAFALPGAAVGAPGDMDNDTVPDASDNCPSVYNIDQRRGYSDGATLERGPDRLMAAPRRVP